LKDFKGKYWKKLSDLLGVANLCFGSFVRFGALFSVL
jgi:hypothetical protein